MGEAVLPERVHLLSGTLEGWALQAAGPRLELGEYVWASVRHEDPDHGLCVLGLDLPSRVPSAQGTASVCGPQGTGPVLCVPILSPGRFL